jgi:hypothetical protein
VNRTLSVAVFVLVLIGSCAAERIADECRFSPGDVRFSAGVGGDVVKLPGCTYLTEPGKPMLPVMILRYLIPSDAEITGYEAVSKQTSALPGNHQVAASQRPQPYGLLPAGSETLDSAACASQTSYPEQALRLLSVGTMAGYRIATFALCPLRWNAKSGSLELFTRLDVNLEFTHDRSWTSSPSRRAAEQFASIVACLVRNPGQVAVWKPSIPERPASLLPIDSADLVVVTDSVRFAPSLARFVHWKNLKGIRTRIADLSIATHYPGRDTPERLRGFIADAARSWGTTCFLLAGDYDVVPSRNCWVMNLEPDSSQRWLDTIPTDLYYSDLDGDWDANHNGVFGELGDSVDAYPDVFVGRACLSSVGNCSTFVSKVLNYEQANFAGHEDRVKTILLPCTITQEHAVMDSIAGLAQGFRPARLYQDDLPTQVMVDSLNAGYHLVFEDAHGTTSHVGSLGNEHVGLLNNAGLPVVYVAQACFPGRFDCEHYDPSLGDCFAESLLNRAQGGALACVMNSGAGWVGDDIQFLGLAQSLFQHSQGLGACLAEAKAAVAGRTAYDLMDLYDLNLLGDPTMLVWTDTPQVMAVTHPSIVPAGAGFSVAVHSEGVPLAGALVTLMKQGELYLRATTDQTGRATFSVPSGLSSGQLSLTATKPNYRPYLDSCRVAHVSGPYPCLARYELSDSSGDNDGELDPGETVTLMAKVINCGDSAANHVSGHLHSLDPWVSADSVGVLGAIPAGDSCTARFRLTALRDCPRNHFAPFQLSFAYDPARTCTSFFSIPVPPISAIDVQLDSVIQPKGIYLAGQTIRPCCRMHGAGTATARNVKVTLDLSSGYHSMRSVFVLEPGESRLVEFDTLKPPCGGYSYWCMTAAAGDSFLENDSLGGNFRVLDTIPGKMGQWREVQSLPGNEAPVRDGGWLTSVTGNTGGRLYVLKGRASAAFYSYDPVQDIWQPRESMPKGREGKRSGYGARACSDGQNCFYATKGNNSRGFWCYHILEDNWVQLPDVPAGPNRQKVKGGTDVVYVSAGDASRVYLLKGGSGELWRYDVTGDTWRPAPSALKAEKRKWYEGSFLVYDQQDLIYAFRGRKHQLYAYDIAADTWSGSLDSLPYCVPGTRHATKSGTGSSGVWWHGAIYLLKGNKTRQFWSYEPGVHVWTCLDSLPHEVRGVGCGGDLALLNDQFYALKGNRTCELWCALSSGVKQGGDVTSAGPVPLSGSRAFLDAPSVVSRVSDLWIGYSTGYKETGRLSIFDVAGQSLVQYGIVAGYSGRLRVPARYLEPGVLLVRLETGTKTITRKLVVL